MVAANAPAVPPLIILLPQVILAAAGLTFASAAVLEELALARAWGFESPFRTSIYLPYPRSAVMGATFVARLAGIQLAANAAARRKTRAPTVASGSNGLA
jgi:hypothetical protein